MLAQMRIAVVTVQVPFVRGGAEVLADGLCAALRRAGHEVELIALPFAPHSTEALLDSIASCRLIDLGPFYDRVIALKFPAYLVRHPAKSLWLIHQHHGAYERFFDEFGLANLPDGRLMREAVKAADRLVFAETRTLYAISRTVAERAFASLGARLPVLFPPTQDPQSFAAGEDRGYLFFPSRIAPVKRQELALRALALTRERVHLVFAGVPDQPEGGYGQQLKDLATELGVADRVEWRGFVGEKELRELYSHCRAVLFPPLAEDYGYIAIEAMLSAKAVITCEDSGGPLEFVRHGETGWVTAATPPDLAATLDAVAADPARAALLGQQAQESIQRLGIDWERTIAALLGTPTEP